MYDFRSECKLVDALIDFLTLFDLDFLVYLILPVDVLLVEVFDHRLVDALLCLNF